MKRTITLRVDVTDADGYARVIKAISEKHRSSIIQMAWTRGEEVKTILESKGMTVHWGKGAGARWVADNS